MSARRVRATFTLHQKRRDCFERHAVQMIDDDVQSFMDKSVPAIALPFEAVALTLRKLPN